jgi:hypothetical protein
MRVDWSQSLEGVTVLQLRNILRRLSFVDTEFGATFIAEGLTRQKLASGRQAKAVSLKILAGLVTSGLAEPISNSRNFVLTDTGASLRAARATKRISRTRAERAVAKLVERAKAVNADPLYLHDIAELAVYGSYITDAPDLGDIDVSVRLKARWTPQSGLLREGTERELMVERFEAERPPPPSFHKKAWWRSWPEAHLMRSLKTDSAMVIVYSHDLEEMGCAHRIIFPVTREVPAKPGWACDRREIVFRPAD